MVFPAKHISVSINADPQKVYQYASDPFNMPDWAAGLKWFNKKGWPAMDC